LATHRLWDPDGQWYASPEPLHISSCSQWIPGGQSTAVVEHKYVHVCSCSGCDAVIVCAPCRKQCLRQ
jgi:hypothetical protein